MEYAALGFLAIQTHFPLMSVYRQTHPYRKLVGAEAAVCGGAFTFLEFQYFPAAPAMNCDCLAPLMKVIQSMDDTYSTQRKERNKNVQGQPWIFRILFVGFVILQ